MTTNLFTLARAALVLTALAGAPALAAVGVGANVSFSPNAVTVSQPSTLTITLLNPNVTPLTGATGVSFTNTFPVPVTVANPANVVSTCGGMVTATPGSGTFVSLTGGSIAAAIGTTPGTCTISVNVVANAPNSYQNVIPVGAVTSSNGSNTQAAEATLAVGSVALITGSIAFSNASLHGNAAPTTMTMTMQNPNAVAVTGNGFTMTIQSVMNFATLPAFATTCVGGTVTGSSTNPSLLTLAGATIPPNGSCTVSVDLVARDPQTRNSNTYTQTLPAGSITNNQGGSNSAINGTVAVQTGGFVNSKVFVPAAVTAGGNSVITYTITNYNFTPLTGITFSDTIPQPAGGSLIIANPPAPTNTCGGDLVAVDGATSFTYGTVMTGSDPGFLTGAVGQTNCVVSVTVKSTYPGMNPVTVNDPFPGATWGGIFASTIASVPLTINPVSVISGSKAFSGLQTQLTVTPFTLTITLRNAGAGMATITSLTDQLTTMGPGLTFGGTPGVLGGTCGSSTTTAAGGTSLAITGGTIPPGANGCTIIVPITAAAGAPVGNATNTISANAVVTSAGNNLTSISGTASLTRALSVATSWTPATVVAGEASRATVTLSHPNGAQALTGLSFTDNLTATMGAGHVVANPSNATTNCAGATLTAVSGSAIVTLTGASLGVGATSCTTTYDVVTPVSDGSGNNIIYSASVTNNQNVLANDGTNNANATLTRYVNTVTVNNSFTPSTTQTNGTVQLQIQINNNNSNATALTGVGITDTLPSGLVLAATPNATLTGPQCTMATITATPGASSIVMSGASIGRNAQCVLSVTVRATSAGNLVNTIPAGALVTNTGTTNPALSTATLTASGSAALSITKDDSATSVATGTSTTYTIVARNAGPDAVAGVHMVDNPPANMTITSWTCVGAGGSSCPASGTGPIDASTFLAVGGTATYSVIATIADNASGTITNTSTLVAPTGVINATTGASTASDTDTIIPGKPVITFPADGSSVGPNPQISGISQPAALVTVYEGLTVICITTANNQGNWNCNSNIQPGTHTLIARQTDALSNTSQPSQPVTFTVLSTPSIAITNLSPVNATNATNYTVNGTCTTSAGTVNLSIGGIITTAPCSAGAFTKSLDVHTVSDGVFSVTASQTNVAGTASDTKAVVKDSTVAAPVITSPSNGAMVSPQPPISGTGEAGSAVTVREGSNTVCTATTNSSGAWNCISTLSTGTHTVVASQVDVAGNVSTDSASVTLTIVSSAPVVSVTAPATIAAANAAMYPVSGACSTFAGTVTVTVGTVMGTTTCTNGAFTTTLNVSTLPDAQVVTITASQTNVLGTATGTGSTRKDTVSTPPVITTPGDGTTVAINPGISGTSESSAVVTVREGATIVCTTTASTLGAWSCPSTLVAGSHTIAATAVDIAGNTSNASSPVTFTVVAGPALILNTPAIINSANAGSYTVSGTCLTTGGMVNITIRTVSTSATCVNGQFTVTMNVSGIPDGATVPIVATQGTSTDTKSTPKDTQVSPPVILAPAAASTVARNPTISGTAEANASVTVREGANTVCTTQATALGTWQCPSTLDIGNHTITATQTDPASNTSAATVDRTFTVSGSSGLLVAVTQPGAINAANASAFAVTGQCTTAAGDVALLIGTISVTVNCVNGAFTTTQDLSTLADGPAINFAASQTDLNGTFTDTKAALKDTVVVAPVIVAPATAAMVAVNPVISGTSEAAATVTVREGTTVVCTAIADSTGAWSCVSNLGMGPHSITATQTDVAGNVSTPSTTTMLTVTSLPVVTLTPTPINKTNQSAWVAAGNCTTSAGVVTITVGTVMKTATCANGMYTTTIDASAIADAATVTVSAAQTNASGTSTDSHIIAKDTVAPAAPVVTNPPADSTIPTASSITGTSEAGSSVTVTLDGMVVGTAIADSNGNWTLTLTMSPALGAHNVTAVATDAAGNDSPASARQNFTIAAAMATPVVITSPSSGTGVPANQDLPITGTAPVNSTVTVFVDGLAVGTALSNATGAWTFTVPGASLPQGAHQLTAKVDGGTLSAPVAVNGIADIVNGNVRYSGGGIGKCSTSPAGLSLWFAMGALLLLRRRR